MLQIAGAGELRLEAALGEMVSMFWASAANLFWMVTLWLVGVLEQSAKKILLHAVDIYLALLMHPCMHAFMVATAEDGLMLPFDPISACVFPCRTTAPKLALWILQMAMASGKNQLGTFDQHKHDCMHAHMTVYFRLVDKLTLWILA